MAGGDAEPLIVRPAPGPLGGYGVRQTRSRLSHRRPHAFEEHRGPVAVGPGGVSAVHEVTAGCRATVDVARCALLSDPARMQSLAASGLTAVADPHMQALAERVRRRVGAPVALV